MNEHNTSMTNILAGSFFIIGLVLIFLMVFMIGKDKGFSQPKFKIAVLFSDVGGLIEGAPVQLAGVNVGTVSDISFLDQSVNGRKVKVEVSILSKYRKQLKHDVRFTIVTEGILGEKLIEVSSAETGPVTDLSQPVFGKDPVNIQDLAEVFTRAAESFTNASEDFNRVDVHALSTVLADTAQSLSETARGVNTILSEMRYLSIKSKRMLDRLEQRIIDGDLFKVF